MKKTQQMWVIVHESAGIIHGCISSTRIDAIHRFTGPRTPPVGKNSLYQAVRALIEYEKPTRAQPVRKSKTSNKISKKNGLIEANDGDAQEPPKFI